MSKDKNDSIRDALKELRESHLIASQKADSAKASKMRAQKTLTKAKRTEKSATQTRDLALANMKLLCAENNIDFEKEIKEIDLLINSEK